jgi:hypothetical protein
MAARMNESDFIRLMEPVARRLWGEPNPRLSNHRELRWGTHGSRSVDLQKGVWHDHETGEGGGNVALIERETGRTGTDAMAWLVDEGLIDKPQTNGGDFGSIVASYDYKDETGKLLFQVVRFDPKDFRQRRPDGGGGWTWKLGNVRRVLYRLQELIKAVAEGKPVVVEGEKDVESLLRIGITATTNPGGASRSKTGTGKWRKEYNTFLRGASVTLMPDNDDAGRAHMRHIAASLHGTARDIRILDLAEHWPDGKEAPAKADVSDWLAHGGIADELRDLIAAAAPWNPATDESQPGDPRSGEPGVSLDEFYAYMPQHAYIFAPTGELWPASSVNSRLPPIVDPNVSDQPIKPAAWLDQNRPVEQMSWIPGSPQVIANKLIAEGGLIDAPNKSIFNLYRPPPSFRSLAMCRPGSILSARFIPTRPIISSAG